MRHNHMELLLHCAFVSECINAFKKSAFFIFIKKNHLYNICNDIKRMQPTLFLLCRFEIEIESKCRGTGKQTHCKVLHIIDSFLLLLYYYYY